MNWLDHGRTLREQGIDDNETLLLRRKFFYSDQNVDSRDPVQLNLLYVQVPFAPRFQGLSQRSWLGVALPLPPGGLWPGCVGRRDQGGGFPRRDRAPLTAPFRPQARDDILNGSHPVSFDKACEFAGYQCQIQFGPHNEQKHKPGFLE